MAFDLAPEPTRLQRSVAFMMGKIKLHRNTSTHKVCHTLHPSSLHRLLKGVILWPHITVPSLSLFRSPYCHLFKWKQKMSLIEHTKMLGPVTGRYSLTIQGSSKLQRTKLRSYKRPPDWCHSMAVKRLRPLIWLYIDETSQQDEISNHNPIKKINKPQTHHKYFRLGDCMMGKADCALRI